MIDSRTRTQRCLLAGMAMSGLDRLYQQLDREIGFILTMHHVRDSHNEPFQPNGHLSVTADFLDQLLQLIKDRGVDIISIDEVAERLTSPHNPGRFCAVTLDDAYVDNMVEAAPVLRSHDAPYTVYVASGLVQGTAHLWWEKLEDLVRVNQSLKLDFGDGPSEVACATVAQKYDVWKLVIGFMTTGCPELETKRWFAKTCAAQDVPLLPHTPGEILRWEDVRSLDTDPLCTIGSHTVSHYALARLPAGRMWEEIEVGGIAVREQLGYIPKHLAYPYGYQIAAGAREFEAARELGLKTAVTTRPGMLFPEHSNYMTALPRISVNGYYQSLRHFAPLTSGLPTRIKSGFRRLNVA